MRETYGLRKKRKNSKDKSKRQKMERIVEE